LTAANVDGVTIEIGAEIGELRRQLEAAGKALREAGTAIERTMRGTSDAMQRDMNRGFQSVRREASQAAIGVQNAFRGAVTAIVGGFTLDAIINRIREVARESAELVRQAERAGVSINQALGIRATAASGGIDGNELVRSVADFRQRMIEAQSETTELGRLLQANNIPLRDSAGALRPTLDVMADFAELVRNAGPDAERVGRMGGFNENQVALLRQGGDALRRMAIEAANAANTMEGDAVRSAAELDRQFNSATNSITGYFRGTVVEVAGLLGDLRNTFGSAFDFIQRAWNSVSLTLLGDVQRLASGLRQMLGFARDAGNSIAGLLPRQAPPDPFDVLGARADTLRQQGIARLQQGANDSGIGFNGGVPTRGRRPGEFNWPGTRNEQTNIPPAGGGGGGGGAAERDRSAEIIAQLERELQLVTAVGDQRVRLQNEERTVQLLRQANVEATSEEGRRIAELVQRVNDARRAEEERQAVIRATHDLIREAGQTMGGFFSDIVSGGRNAEEAFMRIRKRITEMMVQALLLGEGPLGRLLGLAGANGAPGGLLGFIGQGLGLIAGRATGGPVNAGEVYRVNERGMEFFRPSVGGTVIPIGPAAAQAAGGGGTQVINIDARGADATVYARLDRIEEALMMMPRQNLKAVGNAARDVPGFI